MPRNAPTREASARLVHARPGGVAGTGSCLATGQALPAAQLVVIPGAGHVVNLAAPAAFDAALLDFLERLEG